MSGPARTGSGVGNHSPTNHRLRHPCRCDTADMRHLRPPLPGTIRIAGTAEVLAGLVLVLIWVTGREALYLVLALALIAAGLATMLTARSTAARPRDVEPGFVEPGFDEADEDDDTARSARLVSLDRSTLPDETDEDHRTDIEPELVPTLEALVSWLDEQEYLPVDRDAAKASWTLRLGLRRAAVLEADGDVHYLLPAQTPLRAGSRITAQYRARR